MLVLKEILISWLLLLLAATIYLLRIDEMF